VTIGIFAGTVRVTPNATGVGVSRDRVQAGAFLGEHHLRGPPGHPVLPGVDHRAEPRARLLQLGERPVLAQEVRVLGDQVGLGDLHRRLRPTLGRRIDRLARVDRDPVVAGEVDHRLVADRDPRDVLGP